MIYLQRGWGHVLLGEERGSPARPTGPPGPPAELVVAPFSRLQKNGLVLPVALSLFFSHFFFQTVLSLSVVFCELSSPLMFKFLFLSFLRF